MSTNILFPPPEPVKARVKLDLWPTLSVKFGRFHIWCGRTKTHDRLVFFVVELTDDPAVGFKFHWLFENTPMFSLLLWPVAFASLFWFYPGENR